MLTEKLPDLALPVNAGVAAQLEYMITQHRLPHAIVIEGAVEEKNVRLATLLAQAWLCRCESVLGGECRVCRILGSGGKHSDFEIITAQNASGAIPVDEIRALHGKAGRTPNEADGMAFLLQNGDKMQRQAQNAFLKLFEEPPDGVLFMLTCRSCMKLLETIRSRACIIHVEWSDEGVQGEGEDAQDELERFAREFAVSLLSKNDMDCVVLTGRFSQTNPSKSAAARREFIELLGLLREIFRQALLISVGAGSVLRPADEAAGRLAAVLAPERLQSMIEQLDPLERAAVNNATLSLVATAACVKLRSAAGL